MFHWCFWTRQNLNYVDIKWNIYHRYCLIQSSKIVFHWFIVQDNKNSISSRSYSYEPITKIQISCIGQFVINEKYFYFCLHAMLYCETLKISYHYRWYYHIEFKKGEKNWRCPSLASGKLRTHVKINLCWWKS